MAAHQASLSLTISLSFSKSLPSVSSVAHSCPTHCDPMNHSIPGLPVHHQLTTAAKSLQSCLTLCDPIDGSQPTRLPCPWDSPGKNTGVGCHFRLQCMKVKLLSRVQPSATPWTAAYQAPSPMGFSRQEYWSGVPLQSPANSQSLPKRSH